MKRDPEELERDTGDPESFDEYPESDQSAERRFEEDRPPHHNA